MHGFQLILFLQSIYDKQSCLCPQVHQQRTRMYIREELAAGNLQPAEPWEQVNTSPIGINPKPHQPVKFCLIVNLKATGPTTVLILPYVHQVCGNGYCMWFIVTDGKTGLPSQLP